ncbi:hypothetical protein GG344DRAFT_77131 [Lentinula edodes]|nr:hypothetical protein GG344DRAFT_77131 [Lentinula edodes]
MKYSDFDSTKEKQSFRPTPYSIGRTTSQSNTVSFQSSCPVYLDGKIGQFSSVPVADDNDDLASRITDDMKKTFRAAYRRHGTLKDRRKLNIKYHHIQMSVVPVDLSRPYEIGNFTNMQFEESDDSIHNRQADDVGRGELSYGHSVTNQHSSKSIIPISVESSSASYFQNEELPVNKNFTPIGPCYTPALLYASPSPRVTASTTLYGTLDSTYQEFSESPYSVSIAQSPLEVNSVEHSTTIWGRHNDPHTYAASTASTELTTIYNERPTYMSNLQNCADEFGRCGRATINASDYLHCGAYAESETGNIHCSLPDNTLLAFRQRNL